jgi:hypothetical protein
VIVTVAYQVRRTGPARLPGRRSSGSPDARRRDGAYAWGVSEDAADPALLVEWFFVESWAEHIRQHHRVSKADATFRPSCCASHAGAQPPQ